MFVVERNRLYVTIANVVTVASRVKRPAAIAIAATTPIHSIAMYSARGSSGYHDAYGW